MRHCPVCSGDWEESHDLREHCAKKHPDFNFDWWQNTTQWRDYLDEARVVRVATTDKPREELFMLHKKICDKALTLMKKKNADYSKTDPYDNLMTCEFLKITSAENGVLIRMGDKLSRLSSVLEKGAEVSESIEDSVIDLVNYSVLLLGLRNRKINVLPALKGEDSSAD